ncbi:MAG: hypothetical protein WBD36_13420 [Bacteroidota bacterium]
MTIKDVTIISNDRNSFIELIHRHSDPGVWIVRRWKKTLFFKKRLSSDWFEDGHQAIAFAHELKRGKGRNFKTL